MVGREEEGEEEGKRGGGGVDECQVGFSDSSVFLTAE